MNSAGDEDDKGKGENIQALRFNFAFRYGTAGTGNYDGNDLSQIVLINEMFKKKRSNDTG